MSCSHSCNTTSIYNLVEATSLGLVLPQVLASISQDEADEHLLAVDHDRHVAASCSLWWNKTPLLAEKKTGFIGHFSADSLKSAGDILEAACSRLAAQGVNLAVGPVDGSTWNNYRFVLRKSNDEPPFFLEPTNDPAYPDYFQNCGFETLATYYSAVSTELRIEDERNGAVSRRMQQIGVRIRAMDASDINLELSKLYRLSVSSFKNNFLYTPISEDEFIRKSSRLMDFLHPELTKIAEHNGKTVGFLLVFPDMRRKDTVILKTLARKNGALYSGLGNILVAEVQNQAGLLGYKRVIHALFHESNHSAVLSKKYAGIMREYILLSKRL